MKRAVVAVLLSFCAVRTAAAEVSKTEFGGHDAFGLSVQKEIVTDCKITWQDTPSKKTYCFSSDEMKKDFAKDVKGNLAKAEAFYKTLPVRKDSEAAQKVAKTAEETKAVATEKAKDEVPVLTKPEGKKAKPENLVTADAKKAATPAPTKVPSAKATHAPKAPVITHPAETANAVTTPMASGAPTVMPTVMPTTVPTPAKGSK